MDENKANLSENLTEETRVSHRKIDIPIKDKYLLTIEEAAAYTNVGIGRIRYLTMQPGCKFVLWIGSRRVVKRKKFEEFLDSIEEL